MIRLTLLALLILSTSCSRPNNYLYPVPPPAPQRKVDPGPPGALHGLVTNAVDGVPLFGVSVILHQYSPTGPILYTTSTDSSGSYDIQRLDPGNYAVDFNLAGYVPILGAPVVINPAETTTLSESMTTILAAGQYRIILNWVGPTEGAVRDVDSYLIIPGLDSPVGFENRDPGRGANLDHDDTQWFGPETITITSLGPGTYKYYVNNYNVRCDSQALARSGVTIRVYRGADLLKTYTIPPDGIGITYEAFDIVEGQLVDVNRFADFLPTYGSGILCDRYYANQSHH